MTCFTLRSNKYFDIKRSSIDIIIDIGRSAFKNCQILAEKNRHGCGEWVFRGSQGEKQWYRRLKRGLMQTINNRNGVYSLEAT
jgi:hypothetical protein